MRGRLAALTAAMAVLCLALSACGGGGEASTAAQEERPRVVPLEVSGGGSAQFRVKGADNSIANYGTEAARPELRRAAGALHGYLVAVATEDWSGACARMSRAQEARLMRLGASARGGKMGCPATLAKLIGNVSATAKREGTVVDAISLRRQDGRGFLIYRGAHRRVYVMLLREEGGRWAMDGLSPSALG